MPKPDHTPHIDNLSFLNAIFGDYDTDVETPCVCAFSEPPEQREADGKGWGVFHPLDAQRGSYIASRATEHNTYFCISSVKPADILNRRADSLVATYVFPLDDIGYGPGAKYKPETVPMEPSYIIETSPRNYQYGYLPTEPIKDLALAQALVKCMAEEHADKGATIAAKLMRLPVGHNNKQAYDEVFQVRMRPEDWHPERKYTVEQLAEAFKVDPAVLEAERTKATRRQLNVEQGNSDGDRLFTWLTEKGQVVENTNSSGFATVICPWSDAHTGGGDTAQYSPYGAGGDDYGTGRQFKCYHDHCASRTIQDFKRQCVSDGGPNVDDPLLSFLERYVYCESDGYVCDREKPRVPYKTLKLFNDAMANQFQWGGDKGKTRMPYSIDWLRHPRRVTVGERMFFPGRSVVFDDLIHGKTFNTFTRYDHPKADRTEVLDTILEQLQFLFGDQYEHALDWLAWTVHVPEVRIKYALLHISPKQGTGRGWLKELMYSLFKQRRYVTTPNISDFMNGQFNEWAFESLLAVFDEVFESSQRFKVQDRLREIITENRLQINVKHGYKGTGQVFCNIMFLSNHLNAMTLPDEDRRMWVVLCDEPPLAQERSQEVYDAIKTPTAVAQFYHYLKTRLLVSDFNPNAHAPRTAAFDLVRTQGEDDLQGTVRDIVEGLRRSGVDVVYRKHVDALLLRELPDLDLTEKRARIPMILGDLGCAYLRCKRRITQEDCTHLPNAGGDARGNMIVMSELARWAFKKNEAFMHSSAALKLPGWNCKPGATVFPHK